MQLKKIAITALFLGTACFANAQQKKATPKATTQAKTKTTAAAQGINQQNYGTVLEYLSDVMHCMKPQLDEINSRKGILETWENCYAYNKKSEKTVSFTPSLAIDIQRSSAITGCGNATAPNVMGDEASFFNERYKSLRETFMKMAMVWNDMSHYDRSSNPLSKEAGQKLCQDWITLKDQYYAIRKDLASHNNKLQDQLFAYSVANSPYKAAYTNIHTDMNTVESFADQYTSLDDIFKNKTTLLNDLTNIENTVKEHIMFAATNEAPHGYQDFYESLTNYIAKAKNLANSSSMTDKQRENAITTYNNAYKALVPAYNRAMN